MTQLYSRDSGTVLKHRNGVFCHLILRKKIFLLLLALSSLLVNHLSLANDENSVAPLATFDFAIAETLNAIGHPPRFLAGLEGYKTYSRENDILPYVTNLGFRFLPNLELLASHPPQHILISPPAHANLAPTLKEIADVQGYPLYNFSDIDNGQNHWKALEHFTQTLGHLVNDPRSAEFYIRKINRQFDDLRMELPQRDCPLLLVRLMDERHARIYGKGSVEGIVLNRLGLQNAWQENLDRWGMVTVGATSLFNTEAKIIFLDSPYGADGIQKALLSDGQWRHVPSVRQGNYTIIPVDFWSWGGLPAAQRFANSLVDHLIVSDNASSSTNAGTDECPHR